MGADITSEPPEVLPPAGFCCCYCCYFVFYFYHLVVFICLSNEEMVSVRLRPVTKFGVDKTVDLEFDGCLGNSCVIQSHP